MPGGVPRVASPGMEVDAIRSLGVNPNHVLQHPGFYYYMAARCTESRRERYITALEGEVSAQADCCFPHLKPALRSDLTRRQYCHQALPTRKKSIISYSC